MSLNDILAALGVVLNGIPQALLAASYGFASVPTSLGFIVGAVACLFYGSAIPISFQAETIALAGMLGKDVRYGSFRGNWSIILHCFICRRKYYKCNDGWSWNYAYKNCFLWLKRK